MEVSNVYIAAAFNRVTHTADWIRQDSNSSIVYASNKVIGVWSSPGLPASHVSELIPTGFTKSISALKVASVFGKPCVVAGAGDGSIGLFSCEHGKWNRQAFVRDAHVGSVSALGVLRPSSSPNATGNLFVTGASDGLLKVWTMDETPALVQTIDLKGRFPLDMTLLPLPCEKTEPASYIMALATTTSKIELYVSQADTIHFEHKLTLEGHEDWVRSLDLCLTRTGDADCDTMMLASGSQDASVRLWKIAPAHAETADEQSATHATDDFERMVTKIEADRLNENGEMSTRAFPFSVGAQRWSVTFDALLVGHDGWITGVRWHPAAPASQPAALLSSSADNSLILWTPSGTAAQALPFAPFDAALLSTGGTKTKGRGAHPVASSIWMPSQRFGEVGGASNLGFFGAIWQSEPIEPDGPISAVVAHGWGGSAHIWTLAAGAQRQWNVASPVTGHFGPARSVTWEPCGEYLLSCSDDQTTRLHAQLGTAPSTWHEVARPQSHGYDLHSVSWLDRLNFVSAADEKVLRVFAAPRGFVGTVGVNGLNCARLGTEVESRSALMAAPASSHTILCLEIEASVGMLRAAQRHGDLVQQAMSTHYTSQQDTLTVLVSSTLFNAGAAVTFKQIELYLKWMYAQAWSIAIKKDYMLADINILLCPQNSSGSTIRSLLEHANMPTVLVDDSISATHANLLQGLAASFLSSSTTYEQDPSAVGVEGSDDAQLRTYPVVALGGTFDHLHVGHKILLSMATLSASRKLIVGVTDDAMLTKKSHAALLQDINERISAVDAFIAFFRMPFGRDLERQVVKLEDVAGPAATESDLQALVVTDETLSGAEFIANKRKENQLQMLESWVIGVVGSAGETNLRGDAKALADSKIGSTAIRKWLSGAGPRRTYAFNSMLRSRTSRCFSLLDPSAASTESRPVGASVPPLGLSNRAVFEGGERREEAPSASGQPIGKARESLAAVLQSVPTEEQLSVETLWPELEKLYGHGYEMLWVSANPASTSCPAGRFIASCCRANSAEHAVVRLHDRERNWKECGQLQGHTLSVTRIQWSLDSRFLLSCSRDRSWRMYERRGDEFIALTGERSHARIIWDADFSKDPAQPYTFATASRDKSVKIFRLLLNNEGDRPFELVQTVQTDTAATAITFGVGNMLAIGLENGTVLIYELHQRTWSLTAKLDNVASDQINQLQFRPPVLQDEDDALLACASQDAIVRILRLSHTPSR